MDSKINKAIKLRENGDLKESNKMFSELIKNYPDNAYVNYQYAWSCDVLGTEKEAVIFYERAISLGLTGKDLEEAFLGIGSTYRALGEYEDSKRIFQKGIDLFPENKAIQVFYSMTLYNLKEYSAAMEILLSCLTETTVDADIINFKKAITFYSDKLNERF